MIDGDNGSGLDSMQPLQYSVSLGFRALLYGAVVFALVGIRYAINNPGDGQLVIGTLVAIVAAVYAIMLATFARLTITAEAVTYRAALLTQSILQRDIVGFRILHQQKGANTLKLVSRHGDDRSLKIAMIFGTDPYFDGWLNSIPAM